MNDQLLLRAVELHTRIHGHHPVYSSIDTWKRKLSPENQGIVLMDEQERGYLAAYYSVDSATASFHLWQCGVLEEHRGEGVFTALITALAKRIKTTRPSCCCTVCTIPEKYPAMYAWITNEKRKARVLEETILEDGRGGRKIKFEIDLSAYYIVD